MGRLRSRQGILQCINEGLIALASISYDQAMERFMTCHQSAVAMGDETGAYLGRLLLTETIIRCSSVEDSKEINLKLAHFITAEELDEDVQAWAAYYVAGLARRRSRGRGSSYTTTETCWLERSLELAVSDLSRYEASMELGYAHVKSFNYVKAVECFKIQEMAATTVDAKVYALFNLSIALILSGEFQKAAEAEAELLNLVVTANSDLPRALSTKLKGIRLERQDDYHDEAKNTISEATRLLTLLNAPSLEDHLQSYLLSETTCCWSPRKILMLTYCGRQAAGIVPRHRLRLQNLVCDLDDLSISLVLQLDMRAWHTEGLEYLEQNEYDAAMALFTGYHQVASAINDQSGAELARRYLVLIINHLVKDRCESLTQIYERLVGFLVVSEEPREAWASFFVGQSVSGLAALEWLHKCMQHAKTDILKFQASWDLGDVYATNHLLRKSVECYEIQRKAAAGLEDGELEACALYNLCDILCHLEDMAEARQILDQLNDLAENSQDSALAKALSKKADGSFGQMVKDAKARAANAQALMLLTSILPSVEEEEAALGRYLDALDDSSYFCASLRRRICLSCIPKAEYHAGLDETSSNYATEYMLQANICFQCLERQDLDEAALNAARLLQLADGNAYNSANALVFISKLVLDGRDERLNLSNDKLLIVESLLSQAEDLARSLPYSDRRLLRSVLRQQGLCYFLTHRWQEAADKLEESIKIFMETDTDLLSLSQSRISFLEIEKGVFRALQAALVMQTNKNERKLGPSSSWTAKRALIWAERERSRDLLYCINNKQSERQQRQLEELSEFERSDEWAWKEIESIVDLAGEDTVLLVLSVFTDDALICYLLHCGTEGLQVQVVQSRIIAVVTEYIQGNQSANQLLQYISDNAVELHRLLIDPWKEILKNIQPTKMIIVPTEELSLIPFAALNDNTSFLIQKYALSCAPSLRVFKECEMQRLRLAKDADDAGYSALVVGNPANPDINSLQFAQKEAESVAKLLQHAGFHPVHLLQSSQASTQAVSKLLPTSTWIHVASHAVVNSDFPKGALIFGHDNNVSSNSSDELKSEIFGKKRFQFSMPLTRDDFETSTLVKIGTSYDGKASTRLSSNFPGVLTGDEMESMGEMRAMVVVLSACSTGLGQITGEGILGLCRSLHKIGVPTVVVSLWNVDDEATSELMNRFYAELQEGKEVAIAHQQAMTLMIEDEDDFGHSAYETKHWAPFIISGSISSKLKTQLRN